MKFSIDIEAFNCTFKEISTRMNEHVHPGDIADVVVKRAVDVLKAKGALIRTLNSEMKELDLNVAHGLSEGFLSKGPIYSKEVIEDLCREDAVRVIDDILNDPRIQYPKETWEEGIRMVVDSPIVFQDRLAGIMQVFFGEQRRLTDEELNFLLFTSRQGACAMEKAALIEGQRTQYEQLALRTEKLSALGRMAAGIAHEINNPLTGILLFSTNMRKKVPEGGPIKEGLDLIVREATRCKGIIQDLLEFSRDREPNKVMANLTDLIEKALSILENEFRLHQISVEKDLSGDVPDMLLDVNLMQQVFVNLFINAVEAIQKDGVIKIRCHLSTDQAGAIIEISDTGCGIASENLVKIFEPFFSSKTNGSGLGLAVSYGIVQKHGGDILVSSQPGEGTRFTIELPLVKPTQKATDKKPIKVLLVDDEKDFVETLSNRIGQRSLEPAIALNGEEALELVFHQVPDVMILDLKMPHLDGIEVLRRVKQTNPEVEIIILTGHGAEYNKVDALLWGAFDFMEKPVDIDRLINAIHNAYKHKIGKKQSTKLQILK